MKIRSSVWAVVSLILAIALCVFRFNSQQLQAQSDMHAGIQPNVVAEQLLSQLSPEQQEERRQRQEKYKNAWIYARDHVYKARQNNGKIRNELTVEQLPVDLRKQAKQISDEYKNFIYPTLKAYLVQNKVMPGLHPIPSLERFMLDPEYKGTGPKLLGRNSWAIGTRWRLDGTMVSRDVYSKEPPNAPHDAWADNTRFAGLAHGFLVTGWDDGRVTFDPIDSLYQGIAKATVGNMLVSAAPGQAGIPPSTVRISEKRKRHSDKVEQSSSQKSESVGNKR